MSIKMWLLRFMRDELAPQQDAFEASGKPTKEIWQKLGRQVRPGAQK